MWIRMTIRGTNEPVPGPFSQVERNVAARLRAADQHVTIGWIVDRVRRVADLPRYQAGLAGMAHAGTAGPAHRYVAGFCKLQQARVALVPAGGQAAARERDLRAGARRPGRLVRR